MSFGLWKIQNSECITDVEKDLFLGRQQAFGKEKEKVIYKYFKT